MANWTCEPGKEARFSGFPANPRNRTILEIVQILSPRLEIKTARRIDLRRAVSRLVVASYANHKAQISHFKRATLFETRRKAFSRNRCVAESWGVQIQSPLPEFGSLVRVLFGELSGRLCEPNRWSHVWPRVSCFGAAGSHAGPEALFPFLLPAAGTHFSHRPLRSARV